MWKLIFSKKLRASWPWCNEFFKWKQSSIVALIIHDSMRCNAFHTKDWKQIFMVEEYVIYPPPFLKCNKLFHPLKTVLDIYWQLIIAFWFNIVGLAKKKGLFYSINHNFWIHFIAGCELEWVEFFNFAETFFMAKNQLLCGTVLNSESKGLLILNVSAGFVIIQLTLTWMLV